MFDVYIKNYMNGSTKVAAETKMLTIPVADGAKHYINKPIVKLDWSSTGSFDFEVEPKSQFYNSFIHLRTIIRVEYDGDTIFRGRVLTIDNTLWGTRKIKCEDQYGFFRDGQHAGVADDKRAVISMSSYIRALIDEYNQQMAQEPDKMFYVGEIPGNYSASIAADQQCPDITEKFGSSSWQEIKACLDDVGSGYGGHWRVRYSGGKAYLDLLKNYFNATINAQPIELKKNLLDLSNSAEVDNIFTAVIPLGSSESTTEGNTTTTVTTTIEGYNANLHEGNYIKVPDLVNIFSAAELNVGYHTLEDYRDAIDKYGMIFKTVSFSNADSQALLWSYATDWIKNNYLGTVTDFSIKLVDFHQLSQTPTYEEHASTQKYMVGDRVRVRYPIFVNGERQIKEKIMTIKGISYDLFNPENTTLTVGIPSDLLDHEYGQKKTKAKKKSGKSDNTGTPTPKGGRGSGAKYINVHRWVRGTITNSGWGNLILKARATYQHDPNHPRIAAFASIPTYKIATYTGMDNVTYHVAFNKAGFFVCNPLRNNIPIRWIATADNDGNITIEGVAFNLNKEFDIVLKLCEKDDVQKVDKNIAASVDGNVYIGSTPTGTSVKVLTTNLHAEIKKVIANMGIYGTALQIGKFYKVINPAQDAGHGFKKIAQFKSFDGDTHYVVLGKVGCGVSNSGRITSDAGAGIDNWIAKTDKNGKLTIGSYTYDVNKEWSTIEDLVKEDADATVTISENDGDPGIELNPNGGTAGFGRKEDGSWFIKLNDTITYTDKDGNVVTKKGFVTAEDFNLPEIPSFKTKLAVIDEAIIARLTVGEFSAYQVTVNSQFNSVEQDLIAKGASITKLNSDINLINSDLDKHESELLQHASELAGHQVTLTKIDSDITTINSDIDDIDAELLAQGKTITKIGSDVTVIGGDLTDAQRDIAANGESITAINSDVVSITGRLDVNEANIRSLQTDKLATSQLDSEISKLDMVSIKAALVIKNGGYIRFEGSRDKMELDQFTNLIVDVEDGTYVNNSKTVNFVTLTGSKKSITFSRATTLSGKWSGQTYTVTASPQTNTKKYINLAGLTATGNVTVYGKLVSQLFDITYTDAQHNTPVVSGAQLRAQIDATSVYTSGESAGKTTGWDLAKGKNSIPGFGSGTTITPKWPGSNYNTDQSRTYELYSESNNIVTLRYNTAAAGQTPSYHTAARIMHNKYSAGYTAGESAGYTSGHADGVNEGKTIGWNLAKSKASIPGNGTTHYIIAYWPSIGYDTQTSRQYVLRQDGSTMNLQYVSGTGGSGQPVYSTAATKSIGYTLNQGSAWGKAKLQMKVLQPNGRETGWSNVKGYQDEYSVKGSDNCTYYFRASAGYWGWNTEPSVSFSSD